MSDDIRVIHGDCLDVLPTLEAGSVDAIVTDPPYGTEAPKDGYGRRVGKQFIQGDADLSLVEAMLSHAPRLLKPGGWLAFFCSPKRRFDVESLCRVAAVPVRGEVVWDKKTPGLGGGIRYQHETILLCCGDSGRDSLFSVISEFCERERHGKHPHQKPLRLIASLVRYCSRPGELILDPFAGSGTTPIACRKSGRRCLAVESDARWIPVINRRLADAATPLFDAFPASP